MAGAVALLLAAQLIGEVLARVLGAPIPGPVLGMLLLLAWFAVCGEVPPALRRVADALLSHLPLLFVPAGVGLINHLGLIRAEFTVIASVLVISTVLTLAVTALVLQWLTPNPVVHDDER